MLTSAFSRSSIGTEDVTKKYLKEYPDDDNPTQFYRSYYTRSISLQGGGQSGGLGLDCRVFGKRRLFMAAFPQITLGLNSTQYKTLDLAPSLPSSLLYYKMENLAFHGVKYDVTAGSDFVRMSNVARQRGRHPPGQNTTGVRLHPSARTGRELQRSGRRSGYRRLHRRKRRDRAHSAVR